MKDIVLIGAGGFGREVAWLIENINNKKKKWNLIGFIDEIKEYQSNINGIPVLGGMDWFELYHKDIYVACTIANPKTRENKISQISKFPNVRFATLIEPSVLKSKYINIGEGVIICAGSTITVNVEIGNHVIINLDCTIGHDAIIDDYCTIYPSVNISGNTHLNKYVEMGTGSQIIQGLEIGEGTIVGAGAVIVKDLPEYCTAVGLPAKPIKFHRTV